VRDGDGASLRNLFAEARNDGAVTAQDIAEACGDVARAGFVRGAEMGVQGLDVHFSGALGGTHDVGGVDGLVRGDHDEALDVVFTGNFRHVHATPDVIEDGFTGIRFHERHVFVGGCVEDDFRAFLGDDEGTTALVADVSDDGEIVLVREAFADFKADVVEGCFGVVEEDQARGAEAAELANEFAPDATRSPCDHDALTRDLL
jgi:hypothetical protein